ncbi:MAG: phosphatase PAP2 family protein [Paludibacteraceae bacterium]|nr:phosphatase PAP2 family protein [Paludibacteraceae bacterium]
MKKNTIYLLLLLWCTVISQTVAKPEKENIYCALDKLPEASEFLPKPPTVNSYQYAEDVIQWTWGKSVRHTERGTRASDESDLSSQCLYRIMGEALGIQLSEKNTPAICNLIRRCASTGNASIRYTKNLYRRERPFMVFNDQIWGKYDGEHLRKNGSYPSGHQTSMMTAALAVAEIAPEKQDTILRRGFEYGDSRVIVGAHWQSDVDAARLAAAATFVQLHNESSYTNDMMAAYMEYQKIKGRDIYYVINQVHYPHIEKVLGTPVDYESPRFYADVMSYISGKEERNTERGQQAGADGDPSLENQLKMFSECINMEISETNTPALMKLMEKTRAMLKESNKEAKKVYFRKRPYVQFGEVSGTPEYDEADKDESSYPSGHAMVGWGEALVLSQIIPEHMNQILERGYEYGRSRIILGYHYASDVTAARFLASATVVQLYTSSEFWELVLEAKREHIMGNSKSEPIFTEVEESTGNADNKKPAIQGWYNLAGQKLPYEPTESGIYIHDGEKVLVK